MLGIIISGHGSFATGLKSVIELVVGNQENFEAVDFLLSHSTEDLKSSLKSAMDRMNVDGYLFFTDIAGGSPFRKCAEIALEIGNCEVVAGSNVPMIMEILFERHDNDSSKLMKKAIEIGRKQIQCFSINKEKKKEVEEVVDGI